MPVVPRMERPPTMPRRPLSVFAASASPPGTAISTSTSPLACVAAATSAMAVPIIWRGTGLMAGSPGGTGSPARVTVPTPSPARNVTPLPGLPRRTVARMRAPWVTSGSSPASFTTPAVAQSASLRVTASAKLGRSPLWQRHLDRIGERPGQQRRHRPPWRPRWRRCRWSSRGGAEGLARSSA